MPFLPFPILGIKENGGASGFWFSPEPSLSPSPRPLSLSLSLSRARARAITLNLSVANARACRNPGASKTALISLTKREQAFPRSLPVHRFNSEMNQPAASEEATRGSCRRCLVGKMIRALPIGNICFYFSLLLHIFQSGRTRTF